MGNKKFTWADLKNAVNELPESELSKEVHWWGEEKGGKIIGISILKEDYVESDYALEPASVQEYEEGDEPYPVVYTKGTPLLDVD